MTEKTSELPEVYPTQRRCNATSDGFVFEVSELFQPWKMDWKKHGGWVRMLHLTKRGGGFLLRVFVKGTIRVKVRQLIFELCTMHSFSNEYLNLHPPCWWYLPRKYVYNRKKSQFKLIIHPSYQPYLGLKGPIKWMDGWRWIDGPFGLIFGQFTCSKHNGPTGSIRFSVV